MPIFSRISKPRGAWKMWRLTRGLKIKKKFFFKLYVTQMKAKEGWMEHKVIRVLESEDPGGWVGDSWQAQERARGRGYLCV